MTATKPRRMLALLQRLHTRLRRPICERKLLFFTLSCCRMAWPIMVDQRSRRAIEIVELHLVGAASDDKLALAKQEAKAACDEAYAREANRPEGSYSAERYAESLRTAIAARALLRGYTQNVVKKVHDGLAFGRALYSKADREASLSAMARCLRDVFGNPFRPVAFDPTWRTETVVALARQVYESRDFGAMPILADALQDAGCDNDAVLNHCRGDGPHARGCWVVDLVLGKQ